MGKKHKNNGRSKSRESPMRLWSGYTPPKRSSNFMRGVNVRDGTAGETRYETDLHLFAVPRSRS